MDIQIIGVGRLGSQVAFCSLMFLRPDVIALHDIKNLEGDVMDLEHAKQGYKYLHGKPCNTEIKTGLIPADVIVIAAGETRSSERTNEEWMEMNKKHLTKIIDNIKTKPDTKIIIATNLVLELTEWAQNKYPQYNFFHAEDEIMKYRNGVELGIEILKTKGYTNFGPSMSIVEKIKQLSS